MRRRTRRGFLHDGARLSAAALIAQLAGCRSSATSTSTSTSNPTATSSATPTSNPSARAAATPTLAPGDAILELAPGFTSYILDKAGAPMTDGFVVPGAPDGMALFDGPDGLLVLMRNHELTAGDRSWSAHPRASAPALAYDRKSHGGVSRLVIQPDALRVVSSNLVLTGTNRNCSCGAAPFGFLTCEEDEAKDHGYVFLCDPAAASLAPPKRIDAYGRFYHESIAVHPTSMVAYMTEDLVDGALYRFVPRAPAEPFEGHLEALAIDGDVDTMKPGETRAVRWVEASAAGHASLRAGAHARGAARFRRGEGMILDATSAHTRVHFCATAGGAIGRGQVFTLDVRDAGDTLTLVASSTDRAVLDMPDNVAALPSGALLVCEDNGTESRIRGITPTGKVFDVARSRLPGELTGISYSARHELLFVNNQGQGVTLAVRGPFGALTA